MFFFLSRATRRFEFAWRPTLLRPKAKAKSPDAARNGKPRLESLRHSGYTISYLLCDIRHCFQLRSVMIHLLYATEA